MDSLRWCLDVLPKLLSTQLLAEALGQMTDQASKIGFHEGLSYLMDHQHRHGRKKQKMSFDL